MRRASALAALTLFAAASTVAKRTQASPWTLPPGQLVMTAGFNHQVAGQEFLDGGASRNFPLNGAFNATTFGLGVRAGFTDRIEFEAYLPIRVVNYDSDPVILLDQPAGSPQSDLDFYQNNVIDLTRSRSGVGDFVIAGRYGWLRRPFALATEIRVKAPTGYEPPAGTFGVEPTSRQEFVSNLRRFVTPENVQDDVTIGDGQLDVTASMLAGWVAPTGTFFRLGLGYNLRLQDAGDELVGDLRVGQLLGQRVLLYLSARGTLAVETGRRIGISVAAEDPDLPASEFGGVFNLNLREVTLDRDAVDLGGGIIVRMSERLEMNAGYEQTVFGRNTAATHSLSLSLAFRAEFGR